MAYQNSSWWIHNLRQASWSSEPHAAFPCETLKYHLTALTCHSCAHRANSHRLVDSGALNQAYNNEGTWGIIAADLQSSSTVWFRSLYFACVTTQGGVLGNMKTPSCIWRPDENQRQTHKKRMKKGFNPFHWRFIDNTCKGLKCMLDVGDEGRLLFCLQPG